MHIILYEKEFSRGFSWDEHIDGATVSNLEDIPKVMKEILEKNGHSTDKIPDGFYFDLRN